MQPDLGAVFDRYKILVSRETIEKLSIYDALLLKWQRVINLVGPATIDDRFVRHFIDSTQIFQYIPSPDTACLADMGSGAGFPGLIVGIMGIKNLHLIESDVRKATFLRQVSRETGTPAVIHDRRIENCQIADIDVFTARALAPLSDLLGHAEKLATPGRPFTCLFLKGAQLPEEILQARKRWDFNEEIFDSLTENTGKIIKINNLTKK